AFPSGHEAATCCVYVALAILVIGHTRSGWRWIALVPAIAMPIIVAWSRLYRGEHHPTDLTASLIFAGLWLAATTWLIAPNRSIAVAPRRVPEPERRADRSPSVAH
ncbi:MAG TPA: phosphatase PAP2 family protein, partial [Micromonosporaceae bacterium]